MVFGRRQNTLEVPATNPLAIPPPKKEEVEELGVDEIFGDSVSKHFENPNFGSVSIALYPVAGGVGTSTLIRYSQGQLKEDTKDTVSEAVVLVSTYAAEHLYKTQNLLRVGRTPEDQEIVGVVLVEDRPKLSPETIKEAKKTTRMTKHSWGVPYVAEFREPKEMKKLPFRFRKAVQSLVKTTTYSSHK